jgi:hypothetical protein
MALHDIPNVHSLPNWRPQRWRGHQNGPHDLLHQRCWQGGLGGPESKDTECESSKIIPQEAVPEVPAGRSHEADAPNIFTLSPLMRWRSTSTTNRHVQGLLPATSRPPMMGATGAITRVANRMLGEARARDTTSGGIYLGLGGVQTLL